jgi:hypothetical protein
MEVVLMCTAREAPLGMAIPGLGWLHDTILHIAIASTARDKRLRCINIDLFKIVIK